ncbi:GNAT family N-acetyltransferase [Hyphobacterium sp.]|uniref:GNAT family N-acetyltransferase n=1 Tax=Hyphobacterium sp. TaxID=2004662 RepID=UPI003BAB2D04
MRDRIETDRLILRPLEFRDAADIHRHCQDSEITRNTARLPQTYSQHDAEMFVLMSRAAHGKTPARNYAIADKGSDRLIGCCGLFQRYGEGSDWEIGYWMGADHRRQGLTTEAVSALCRAATADLSAKRLMAGHFRDNPVSGHVLEKLGFIYTGETTRLFCMGRMDYAESLDMERNLG